MRVNVSITRFTRKKAYVWRLQTSGYHPHVGTAAKCTWQTIARLCNSLFVAVYSEHPDFATWFDVVVIIMVGIPIFGYIFDAFICSRMRSDLPYTVYSLRDHGRSVTSAWGRVEIWKVDHCSWGRKKCSGDLTKPPVRRLILVCWRHGLKNILRFPDIV